MIRNPEINLVCLGGRLAAAPTLGYYGDNRTAVGSFVLVNYKTIKRRDGSGPVREKRIKVVTFGGLAEWLNDHLQPGAAVLVEGELADEQDRGDDGIDRSRTVVKARRVFALELEEDPK